jgi:hypothetical protein
VESASNCNELWETAFDPMYEITYVRSHSGSRERVIGPDAYAFNNGCDENQGQPKRGNHVA